MFQLLQSLGITSKLAPCMIQPKTNLDPRPGNIQNIHLHKKNKHGMYVFYDGLTLQLHIITSQLPQVDWFKRECFDKTCDAWMVVWELDVPLAVRRGDVMVDTVSQPNSSLLGIEASTFDINTILKRFRFYKTDIGTMVSLFLMLL